jgi:citrate synthase
MTESKTAPGDDPAAMSAGPTGAEKPGADIRGGPTGGSGESDGRGFSPGLAGVLAGETSLALVDGENGRLLYRGYPIGQLVERGTYAQVAELLWTGEWPRSARLPAMPLPDGVAAALRTLPSTSLPMDALRTAISAWGAAERLTWPPTVDQARAITALGPPALAAWGRIRDGKDPLAPDADLPLAGAFLQMLTGERPSDADSRALDAYFIVAAEHGFNASTFTARVITSTRSDLASAVCGAIGALKGPIHGGAPTEVVSQLHEIGSPDRAEAWIRGALDRHERIMGFGHRVYRAYDPRAAALRSVAEGMADMADWLDLAVKVEDIALRLLAERHPERPLKTNVEYYTAAVLQGVRLPPEFYPATFAIARAAGWSAHAMEQAAVDRIIRPDVRYTGPAERDLPV